MRRIIFFSLVMVLHSVTAEEFLQYRPQIPISALHEKKVARADDAAEKETSLEEESVEAASLEEMLLEEERNEETLATETTKKELLKKKILMKKARSRTTKSKRKKPVCGTEPSSNLDISCEQPTTCKPVEGNIGEDDEVQTTCNAIQTSKASIELELESTTTSISEVLRDRTNNQKRNKVLEKGRAQLPIRATVKKEIIAAEAAPRRPMRKKKRKITHRGRQKLYDKGAYVADKSSTSTMAAFREGFSPPTENTPYENYRCGKIAHCANREWEGEPTEAPATEPPPLTTSTTKGIGREGAADEYALSDYQFE